MKKLTPSPIVSRNSLLTKELRITLVNEFASKTHELWREAFDPDYKLTGVPSKIRAKPEGNIHVAFERLPDVWKKENLAAAEAVLDIILKVGGDEQTAAVLVHEKWMERNPRTLSSAHLHVPFSELSAQEQEKDLNQVTLMKSILKKHLDYALYLSMVSPPEFWNP